MQMCLVMRLHVETKSLFQQVTYCMRMLCFQACILHIYLSIDKNVLWCRSRMLSCLCNPRDRQWSTGLHLRNTLGPGTAWHTHTRSYMRIPTGLSIHCHIKQNCLKVMTEIGSVVKHWTAGPGIENSIPPHSNFKITRSWYVLVLPRKNAPAYQCYSLGLLKNLVCHVWWALQYLALLAYNKN